MTNHAPYDDEIIGAGAMPDEAMKSFDAVWNEGDDGVRQFRDCECDPHTHLFMGDRVCRPSTGEEGEVVERTYSNTGDVDLRFNAEGIL